MLFFGAGDYTSALGQIVNRNNKGEINLILTGTADRIDEKESVTAVRVKGNAVSFYSGSDRKIARQSVFGKSDGHRSSYDFSQELPRKIWNVSAFSKENMGVYAFCFGGVFDCFMRSKNPGY